MSKIQLKDICSFSKGNQINGEDLIDNGKYNYLNGGIYPSGKWNDFNVTGNTVTISEGGNSCGYVNYMYEPFWCGAHCYYLYNVKCNVRYLYYALKSQQDKIMKLRSGACMPNIKKSDIGSFEFEYEENPELQIKIISNLDKVTRTIDICNSILEKLDLLVKSRFVEMFGDPETNPNGYQLKVLDVLCNKITDGKHGGCETETGTGRYFIGAREIYDGIVHYDKALEITIKDFEKDYKRCNIEIGDLLIVNTGATIGKSAIATDKRTPFTLLQKSVALLKVKSELILPIFLQYCYIVNFKMYMVESASAQPNLLISKIKATTIYVPPLELQEQFAAFVEQIDKSKLAVKKVLEKAETLKKSLMQEYFG